ncbi:MAG TPA: Gfo/Idh/MocA family oxidoreductase [Pirellulales bacterium]|jgi:predicted dehydrogenase|nr:Gfo/Idh/MocA family oxidoreductase [Pirellulales bacterium]
MHDLSRRRFLEESMLAATAALAAGGVGKNLLAAEKKDDKVDVSPNEKLAIAIIGVNGRGQSHMSGFARPDCEVVYICDADEEVGQKRCADMAKKQGGRKPKFVRDMREVFDDKSVDIVSTATPNHWHALCAIWAIQAGKDVYVEKPVSHNVSEGRRIVETARKYNKICQTGTQSRSMPGTIAAIEYVHGGKIGDVKIGRGLCYKRRKSIGPRGTYEVPASVDYNLWAGPAPMSPLTRPKFHYDWHWQWECGNGDLGNQGIHQMDVARWGLNGDALCNAVYSYGGRFGYEDAGETANTQVVACDYGDKSLIFEVRGLETQPLKGASVGVIFEGSDGYVVMTTYNNGAAFDPKGNMVTQFGSKNGKDNSHFGNFIDAVRSRKHTDLNADILEGHLSSALCHLGNISYRLGTLMSMSDAKAKLQDATATETFDRFAQHLRDNDVSESTQVRFGQALQLDPTKEVFVGNSQADAMLTRDYRAPFVVPKAGQV